MKRERRRNGRNMVVGIRRDLFSKGKSKIDLVLLGDDSGIWIVMAFMRRRQACEDRTERIMKRRAARRCEKANALA